MSTYSRHGGVIRLLYALAAIGAYTATITSRLTSDKTIFLCYHGVLLSQKDAFKRQMAHLSRRDGYSPKVCLTFDDAFENLLSNVLPVLEIYQLHAIIFAVTGNLGEKPCWPMPKNHPELNERLMTAEQIKTLSKHPLVQIGSHTHKHLDLTTLPSVHARTELVKSKQQLEKMLGIPVFNLALPHGAFNETVLQLAREVGYKHIYTLQPMLMLRKRMEESVIGRFSMSPDVWPIEFYLTCAGAYAWLLPWRKFITYLRQSLKYKI